MRKLLLLSVMLTLMAAQLWAQRTITGKVTDDKNVPIQNVTVQIKNTNLGTFTNEEGMYSLKVPEDAKLLVFSSTNMATKEVPIEASDLINVALGFLDRSMQEVVVTAFGIRRDKKSLGYDVTQLNTQQITQAHTTNITNALSGKIAGVRVSGSGGSFAGSSIIIRGYNTFTGNNQPLIVVDGVPIDNGGGGVSLQNGPVNSNRAIDINQEDIESMSVLKGPSAAALYGSRAANGVILITTKKGKSSQKASIQFSSTYQLEQVNRIPDYQNQYGQGQGGVFNGLVNSSWGPEIKGQQIMAYNPATDAFDRQENLAAYPDNVKDIFQTGSNWQNNISFSGGNDRNTYRFSYGYLRNEGVIENNLLNRHNFTINASSKVTNKFTAGIAATYTNNFSKRTQQGNQLSNPLFRGWFTPRSYNLSGLAFEDAIGQQRYPMGEDNPYWTIKHNKFNDEINRLFGNVNFNYRFNDWLQADYKLGTDVFSTFRHGYDEIGARGQANTSAASTGGVVDTRNNFRSFNSNIFVTANKRFNDLNATLILGNEVAQSYSNSSSATGRGLLVRGFDQISNATAIPTPSIGSSKFRLVGAYGDVILGYRNWATVDATLRSDWASTFVAGNNQYFYPSVNVALNVTELVPLLKSDLIENIKLRANWAKVGKAGDFTYATESYFTGASHSDGFGPTISYPFNGLQAFTLSNTAGNADLGPEFTTNKELGVDLGFFAGRLGIDATIYEQKSTDLIFPVPVSAAAGITAYYKNAGDMSTKGLELTLNGTPIKSKTVTWNINWNYTQFKSKVLKLAPGVQNIFLGGFTTPNIRLVEGDEYGQIYGNAYLRDPKNGNKIVVGANGLPQVTSGVQKIGNPNPKYLMGMTNTVSFKGFTVSFLLEYRSGGQIYSRNVADLLRNGAVKETAQFPRFDANGAATKPYLFDAVYTNGQPNTTYVTAEQYWGNSGVFAAAEGFIYGTTWFRVREASLSYNIPSSVLKRTPFGNAEFSVFGRNLYLKAPDYPHLDPEQNVLGVSNAQGLEFNALPQTRAMGAGLKLSF
jgi:TonB-linked SusC/RagA family outer membrane protein